MGAGAGERAVRPGGGERGGMGSLLVCICHGGCHTIGRARCGHAVPHASHGAQCLYMLECEQVPERTLNPKPYHLLALTMMPWLGPGLHPTSHLHVVFVGRPSTTPLPGLHPTSHLHVVFVGRPTLSPPPATPAPATSFNKPGRLLRRLGEHAASSSLICMQHQRKTL